ALDRDRHESPDDRARLVDVALLGLHAGELAARHGLELLEVAPEIVRVGDVAERLLRELLPAVAKEVAVLLVDAKVAALHVGVHDADAGVVEGAAVARLALAQRLLRRLALGDVAGERDDEGSVALPELPGAHVDGDPDPALATQARAEGHEPAARQPIEEIVDHLLGHRRAELRRRLADELRGGVAEAAADLTVHVEDGAARVVEDEAVGGVLDEGAEAVLADAQRLLGDAAVGDVDAGAGKADRRALRVAGHHAATEELAEAAVGGAQPSLDVERRRLAPEIAVPRFRHLRAVVGVDELGPRPVVALVLTRVAEVLPEIPTPDQALGDVAVRHGVHATAQARA